MQTIIKSKKSGGCSIYGIGFIGALIFNISVSTGNWSGVFGVLKAIVWPAFFVYEGFKHFAM